VKLVRPWFIAKDVCNALGIKNTTMALKFLDHDEISHINIVEVRSDGVSQNRSLKIISEPGLYAFILRSRKPEAKEFKRWVTHEVLPSIRKDGGYIQADARMTNFDRGGAKERPHKGLSPDPGSMKKSSCGYIL